MATSIKNEINRTESIKNKTNKAKENINNKLIALGGSSAKNLNDVPNKIDGIVRQYKKIYKATFKLTDVWLDRSGYTLILNPEFTIEKIWISIMIDKEYYSPVQDFKTADGVNIQEEHWTPGGGAVKMTFKLNKKSNTQWELVKMNDYGIGVRCESISVLAIGV